MDVWEFLGKAAVLATLTVEIPKIAVKILRLLPKIKKGFNDMLKHRK